MLRAMLLVVGRVYRGVSTLISRDVEAGVKPAEARRRHALVGLAPDELSPVVEAVVVEVFELGAKAAVLTDGVIRVKGPSPSARGDRVLSFDNAAQYLSGVLWTLAMYTDGVPSDFAFVCEVSNAPGAVASCSPGCNHTHFAVPYVVRGAAVLTARPSSPGHQRPRLLDTCQVPAGMRASQLTTCFLLLTSYCSQLASYYLLTYF